MSDLIKKQDPPTCCLQEVHLSKYKDTNVPKKENYASTNQKKAEMTTFHTHLQGDFKSDDMMMRHQVHLPSTSFHLLTIFS